MKKFILVLSIIVILFPCSIVYGVVYSTWEDMRDNDENMVISDLRRSDNYIAYYNILKGVDYNKLDADDKEIYKKYSEELISSMKKTNESQYSSQISNLQKKTGGGESQGNQSSQGNKGTSTPKKSDEKDLKKLYAYLDGYGVYTKPDVADMGIWTEYYNAFLETNAKDIDNKYLDKYIDFLQQMSNNPKLKQSGNEAHLEQMKSELTELENSGKKFSEEQKKKIEKISNSLSDSQKQIDDQKKAEEGELKDELEPNKNNKIFKQPNIVTGSIKKDGTLQDMISDADNFINTANQTTIKAKDMQNLSGRIYNILLEIGIGLSVIIGIILGIKFLLSGVEEKAEVKKMLWVYAVGCVVTFGSFGIWKLVVSILEQI